MIDYFPADELETFQYAIISKKIAMNNRIENGNKISVLWPSNDIVNDYYEHQNYEAMKRMYLEWLDRKECRGAIYDCFVTTMIANQSVVIMCRDIETPFIKVFCEYLEDKYSIECGDLNQLFTKGKMGSVYIDKKEIHNRAVDLRIKVGIEKVKSRETTSEGRLELLKLMKTQDKIDKLKQLGFKVTKRDKPNLDKMLIEEWVEGEE